MQARHQTCPYCHTPIAIDRFEFASDGMNNYRVCPECDYTWCVTGTQRLPHMPEMIEPETVESDTGQTTRNEDSSPVV